jgi:hypothetical protein
MLWQSNDKTKDFSRCFDETWVNRLYRGFVRNLTVPFRFVVFADKYREYDEGIYQERILSQCPDYGCYIEPFRLNVPMILVGLDTLIVRNIDHLAHYCLSETMVALPRDPYQLERSINGVALVPAGNRLIFDNWHGENDMEWLRRFPCRFIDDLWPGQVVSCKAHRVRDTGLLDARIVYFHGRPKMHELAQYSWVKDNWR